MTVLQRILKALSRATGLVIGAIAVITIFWGIGYRFFLGFTPVWLDFLTFGAVGLAMLVAWALGRNSKFDYSKKVEAPPNEVKPKD
jgi:TRAP-type C4-dicarboxylate transport system permease small subunit